MTGAKMNGAKIIDSETSSDKKIKVKLPGLKKIDSKTTLPRFQATKC